jgi:hypothetical protein
MRKDIALRLREEAERVAREFSKPMRERGNGEIFEVDEILALSEFTAAVVFKKDSGKKAVCFFYVIKGSQWRYFFPTDSHLIGMEAFPEIKKRIEIENFSRN